MTTACAAKVTAPDTPTPTQMTIITATLPPTQTPRPSSTPEAATATAPFVPAEGQTTSQLNVRSAPSADSEQLGTIDSLASVQIVGKDPTSGWWMIVYPQSPSGTGWVTAQYVQVSDSTNVPVVGMQPPAAQNVGETVAGSTVEAGSAAAPSPDSSPVLATAFMDGDSIQSAAISMKLLRPATRSFNYSSDISFPDGDTEDWVRFTLEGQTGQQISVSVVLNCSGSGALKVELIQNSALLQGWDNIGCGQTNQLQLYLFAGAPYDLHLLPSQANTSVSYIAYTVIVQLLQ